MSNKKNREESGDLLRQSAEEKARQAVSPVPEASTPEETKFLLHELRVHQIELEMQNEELRLSQEKLTASQDRYFNLYDLAPVGYFTLSKEGLIIEANHTLATMLGVDKRVLLDHPISRYICREDQDIYYHYNNRLIKASGHQLCKLRLQRNDGTEFWAQFAATSVMDAGLLEVFRTVVSDITELKQEQKALAESEDLLSKVFQANQEAVAVLRMEDGLFYKVNQSYCRDTGYEREELIGKTIKEIGLWVVPEERAKLVALLKEHGVVTGFEVQFRRKDGTERLWDGSWRIIEISGVISIVAALSDVTERRQAERELAEYRNHLEALVANRTAELQLANKELEAFSYSASHDLKAPLKAIQGFSGNLIQKCGDRLDQTSLDELSRIKSNTEKMSSLIDDLLKLSRVGRAPTTMQQVNLSKLVQESVEECKANEPGRNISVDIEPSLTAQGDSQLLQIFFTNLIGNAWKYSSKKAVAKIEFGSTQVDGQKVYYCRDNGAGFDMKYVGKLFTPFQRLHKASEFPGTGIGLSIMARIIQRHEGKIWAEGAVGEGTTFYFTLGG